MTVGNADTTNGVAELGSDGLLALTGPGAGQFLQGQTTADFSRITPMAVIPGAFCDLKGRVIADFLALTVDPERILLRTDRSLIPVLMAHTQKYLMFAKAELSPLDWVVTGAWGDPLANLSGDHDESANTVCAHALDNHNDNDNDSGLVVYRSPQMAGRGMAEIWSAKPLRVPTDVDPSVTTEEASWRSLRIMAGEARVTAATSGKYLPQDLNYDLKDWVSFDKGCYMGQEIIARLHWRGTPKRRLYTASAATTLCPDPGTPLTLQGSDTTLGSVVNACTWQARLLLAIETTEDGIARGLELPDGTVLEPVKET